MNQYKISHKINLLFLVTCSLLFGMEEKPSLRQLFIAAYDNSCKEVVHISLQNNISHNSDFASKVFSSCGNLINTLQTGDKITLKKAIIDWKKSINFVATEHNDFGVIARLSDPASLTKKDLNNLTKVVTTLQKKAESHQNKNSEFPRVINSLKEQLQNSEFILVTKRDIPESAKKIVEILNVSKPDNLILDKECIINKVLSPYIDAFCNHPAQCSLDNIAKFIFAATEVWYGLSSVVEELAFYQQSDNETDPFFQLKELFSKHLETVEDALEYNVPTVFMLSILDHSTMNNCRLADDYIKIFEQDLVEKNANQYVQAIYANLINKIKLNKSTIDTLHFEGVQKFKERDIKSRLEDGKILIEKYKDSLVYEQVFKIKETVIKDDLKKLKKCREDATGDIKAINSTIDKLQSIRDSQNKVKEVIKHNKMVVEDIKKDVDFKKKKDVDFKKLVDGVTNLLDISPQEGEFNGSLQLHDLPLCTELMKAINAFLDLIPQCSIKTCNEQSLESLGDKVKTYYFISHFSSSVFLSDLNHCTDHSWILRVIKKYSDDFSLIAASHIIQDYDNLIKLQKEHQTSLNDKTDQLMQKMATDIKTVVTAIEKLNLKDNRQACEKHDNLIKEKEKKALEEKQKEKDDFKQCMLGQYKEKLEKIEKQFDFSVASYVMRETLERKFNAENTYSLLNSCLQLIENVLKDNDVYNSLIKKNSFGNNVQEHIKYLKEKQISLLIDPTSNDYKVLEKLLKKGQLEGIVEKSKGIAELLKNKNIYRT